MHVGKFFLVFYGLGLDLSCQLVVPTLHRLFGLGALLKPLLELHNLIADD